MRYQRTLPLTRTKPTCGCRHFVSPSKIFAKVAKSKLPAGGWTMESFMTRNGAQLTKDLLNVQRAAKLKGTRLLTKSLTAVMRRQVEKVLELFEASLIRMAGVSATRQVKAVTMTVQADQHAGLWASALEQAFRILGKEVEATVQPVMQSVADDIHEKTTTLLTGGKPSAPAKRVMQQSINEIAKDVTGINKTTQTRLARLISKGIDAGKSPGELMEEIRTKIPQIATNRVPTIVRTELGRAADRAAIRSMKDSGTVTHVSVSGCEAIEKGSPTFRGTPTCNIKNVPIEYSGDLRFHINHTGAITASGFKQADGSTPPLPLKQGEGIGTWEDRGRPVPALVSDGGPPKPPKPPEPPQPPAAPIAPKPLPPTPPLPAATPLVPVKPKPTPKPKPIVAPKPTPTPKPVPAVAPTPKPIPPPITPTPDIPVKPAAPILPDTPPVVVEPVAATPAPSTLAFPQSIDDFDADLVDLGAAGGSTGARIVRHRITGKKFILKRGAKGDAADRLAEEMLADNLYAAAGARVPKGKLYIGSDGKAAKLTEFIDGEIQTLGDYLRTASSTERTAILEEARKGFHLDAWLGNWDTVGTGKDNMLVAGGKVWRVDNGGALRWRAQGLRKNSFDEDGVMELWTLRNRQAEWGTTSGFTINRDAHDVFGGIRAYDLADNISAANQAGLFDDALWAFEEAIENGDLPGDKASWRNLLRTLEKRQRAVVKFGERGQQWKAALMDEDFFDNTSYMMDGMRRAGIKQKLPKSLSPSSDTDWVYVVDENGKPFDHLRLDGNFDPSDLSTYPLGEQWLRLYCESHQIPIRGAADLITSWTEEQAGSSWKSSAVKFKTWVVDKTMDSSKVSKSDFYWGEKPPVSLKKHYTGWMKKHGLTEEQGDQVLTAWHAYQQSLLENVDLSNVDKSKGIARVFRTESRDVAHIYSLKTNRTPMNADNKAYLRGPCESTSTVWTKGVHGDEVYEQAVPICRIMGMYHSSKPSRRGFNGLFAGDNENEFTVNLVGIKSKYSGNVYISDDRRKIKKYSRNFNDWELLNPYE